MDNANKRSNALSVKKMVKIVLKRQVEKDADTFVIIYGLPRTGKTTWGFKLLIHYLRAMKKMRAAGLSAWEVPGSWKVLFKNFFSDTAEDAKKKIRGNPEQSFIFIDEGLDLLSWHQALEREQKELIELLQKTGKKKIFTILITPSLNLLTKQILARAKYMFILVNEPTKNGNSVMVFRNSNNPIVAENNPFGLKKIIKDTTKFQHLSEDIANFAHYLKTRREYVGSIPYGHLNPKLYQLYDKLVKDPSIMRENVRLKSVPYAKYFRIKYAFDNLLYNLKTRDNKTIRQIKSLLTDKFGTSMISEISIKDYIDRIEVMEKQPKIETELNGEIEDEPVVREEELEDVSTDSDDDLDSDLILDNSPERLKGSLGSEEEGDA